MTTLCFNDKLGNSPSNDKNQGITYILRTSLNTPQKRTSKSMEYLTKIEEAFVLVPLENKSVGTLVYFISNFSHFGTKQYSFINDEVSLKRMDLLNNLKHVVSQSD